MKMAWHGIPFLQDSVGHGQDLRRLVTSVVDEGGGPRMRGGRTVNEGDKDGCSSQLTGSVLKKLVADKGCSQHVSSNVGYVRVCVGSLEVSRKECVGGGIGDSVIQGPKDSYFRIVDFITRVDVTAQTSQLVSFNMVDVFILGGQEETSGANQLDVFSMALVFVFSQEAVNEVHSKVQGVGRQPVTRFGVTNHEPIDEDGAIHLADVIAVLHVQKMYARENLLLLEVAVHVLGILDDVEGVLVVDSINVDDVLGQCRWSLEVGLPVLSEGLEGKRLDLRKIVGLGGLVSNFGNDRPKSH